MRHTKIREDAEKVAVAELAKLEAKRKMLKKKKLPDILKEAAVKIIDKIDGDTVIKLISIGTIAYVIKPVIQNSPVVIEKLKKLGGLVTDPSQWSPVGVVKLLSIYIPIPEIEKFWTGGVSEFKQLNEIMAWVLSIGVACVIVLFGPAILEALGGVAPLAGLLLV